MPATSTTSAAARSAAPEAEAPRVTAAGLAARRTGRGNHWRHCDAAGCTPLERTLAPGQRWRLSRPCSHPRTCGGSSLNRLEPLSPHAANHPGRGVPRPRSAGAGGPCATACGGGTDSGAARGRARQRAGAREARRQGDGRLEAEPRAPRPVWGQGEAVG